MLIFINCVAFVDEVSGIVIFKIECKVKKINVEVNKKAELAVCFAKLLIF